MYKLHVSLRVQEKPLPGSPFNLKVVPGPASAKSTKLPADLSLPLSGVVVEKQGCHCLLQVADRMGNPCVVGGAKVSTTCSESSVETDCIDQGDGRYALVWRTDIAGIFDVHVRTSSL